MKQMQIVADITENNIQIKTERFREGKKLRVLDLFSGCGGLSLGFLKMDFEIVAAVEIDKEAIHSHATNFHKKDFHFQQHATPRDIQKTDPSQLLKEVGIYDHPGEVIDIIIGGPPCQAFTRVGRAKLREINNHHEAFLNDPRSQLYKRYLEYVKELAPLAILMENVPDMLNYGDVNIAELVCEDLSEYGYKCQYTLLNTVYYGVPQMRERMFLIALHESIESDIIFPQPTHYIELPVGYHGSRSVALKNMKEGVKQKYYVPAPMANKKLPTAVSAKTALSDLPELLLHLKNKLKRGTKSLTEKLPYKQKPGNNHYQQLMRTWTGFEEENSIAGNVIRLLPRDYPIFKRMKPGDQYPQAIEVAKKLLKAKLIREKKKTGKISRKNSKQYKQFLKETTPPYDVTKFPNKWRKMEPDKPARTLMAHLSKDSYSHIHYDSTQARTISVREAARLQSFPDGFQFSGAMNAAFRQIGNAVPPLMASRLAAEIKIMIENGIKCQMKMESKP